MYIDDPNLSVSPAFSAEKLVITEALAGHPFRHQSTLLAQRVLSWSALRAAAESCADCLGERAGAGAPFGD